jgi:hypothetical protein
MVTVANEQVCIKKGEFDTRPAVAGAGFCTKAEFMTAVFVRFPLRVYTLSNVLVFNFLRSSSFFINPMLSVRAMLRMFVFNCMLSFPVVDATRGRSV